MSGQRGKTRRDYRAGATRKPGNGSGQGLLQDERYRIAQRINEALDPSSAPGRVRTLADMTPEEQAEMRRRYETRGAR